MGKIKPISSLGYESPTATLERVNRDIANLSMRLGSQGIDTTPPEADQSPLTKFLRILNVPGATVRSLISEGTDDEEGIDWGRAISKERIWNEPISGIELLDQMGLAPEEADTFGSKAGRFAAGLATEIVTDPLSYITGGITRPLQVLKAPAIGKPALTLTKQGAVQPLLRGATAGLRGTGKLGAALGDEGVLAARRAAAKAARQSLGGTDQLLPALALESPRALTGQEQLGLQLGTKLRENPASRSFITAFSKNAFVDPAYAAMRGVTERRIGEREREFLSELYRVGKNLTPEQQRIVTDLADDPAFRALWEMGKQEVPEGVELAYEFARDRLKGLGDEKLERELLEELLPNYFPRKLKPDPDSIGGGVGRELTAKQQSARYRKTRDKTLRELLQDPNAPDFEHEFARPLAKEGVESIRAIESYDFFREVNSQFGINADDMLKRYGETLKKGGELPEKIGDYRLVDYSQFLTGGKTSKAYQNLGQVYLPKSIADDVTRVHAAYNTDEGMKGFLKLWDGASNFWKPLVTSLKPSFHVNNFLGNMWNAYLGGMDNPKRLRDGYDILLGREGTVKAGAHKLDFGQMHELANKYGVIDGFWETELRGDAYKVLREGLPKPVSEKNIGKFYNWLTSSGRKLGSAIEGQGRAALFADQMIKRTAKVTGELTDDILDDIARQSADHVNKYLFDYATGLSKFENTLMKRIAPFYSWTRFNIPLQIAEAVNQPHKFMLFYKVRGNLAQVNPLPEETPEWMREGISLGRTSEGGPLVWSPKLPLQDLSRLAPGDTGRELLGMLNPLIKVPLELATGQNFYTGRPIKEYEGQTVNTTLGRVPAEVAHVFDSTSGVFNTIPNVTRAVAPDSEMRDKLRVARVFFPGLFTFDPQQQKISQAYREAERLRDLLRKYEEETGRQVPTTSELQPRIKKL